MIDKRVPKSVIKKIIVLCVVSMFFAIVIAMFFTGHFWDVTNIRSNIQSLRLWTTFNRAFILFFILVYCGLHFVLPVTKMYNWIFDKRWLLGIIILLFLTTNRYHGDSIGYYANAIQPGQGTESSMPILGATRPIRSDEFVATTPSILASSYGSAAFGKYNEIMRGHDTLNIVNGIYLGYATLGYAPQELVYSFMPIENAYSFCWYFPLVFGLLMTLELFYIITNKNKLLSVTGSCLIIFSSFYLWWGFSSYFVSAPGTVVCIYYFLQTKEKWKKVLLGIGTAICFSVFVTNIYPAWQVPLGYMFLAIGIWLLHENWNKIKELKKGDWIILLGAIFFMFTLVISYLFLVSEYTTIIAQTAYPGERVDNGSLYLSKLFYCAQAPFYAYKNIGNPSEAGAFFALFPIPTIMALLCWLREKKKDWLTASLLIAQLPLLLYITTGLPKTIAKLLLLSNSTVFRACDIVGLFQIFFIVIILSRYEKVNKIPIAVAIPLGMLTATLNIYFTNKDFPDYMSIYQNTIMFILITVLTVGLMIKLKNKGKTFLFLSFIAISIFTGIYIRPVMKGFDAIFSKPVASEIQRICTEDPDAKWITNGGGIILPAYSVACGASTVNSVNTYPNLEFWSKLDETSQYEEIYNRYAHVNINFTDEETSFSLIQADYMQVNLSYKDVEKTGTEYLLVMGAPSFNAENGYVDFEKIYEENGMSIYQMIY